MNAHLHVAGEQITETAPRFVLIPFAEIRLTSKGAYLVKNLIPRGGLIIAWGPPKCGKSFWAFDLAMHVALGWEYCGRRVTPGAVVYGAFEGANGFTKRVEAFRMKHLAEETDPIPFYLLPARVDLIADHADLIACIRAQTGGEATALVVLDTLNRSLTGSESKDEDMAAYVKAADAIREAFGCAVLIVHHCGIEGTRPRGHTSLTGAADAQLAVRREADGTSTVTVEWMKDGPEGDVIAFRLDRVVVGQDEHGDEIDSCIVVPGEDVRASRPAGKRRDLSKGAQIALKAIRMAIDEMGAVPPAANHIPPNVKTVTLDQWRTYAYAKGISGSDEPRARQMAFKRGVEALLAMGAAVTWENHYWTNP